MQLTVKNPLVGLVEHSKIESVSYPIYVNEETQDSFFKVFSDSHQKFKRSVLVKAPFQYRDEPEGRTNIVEPQHIKIREEFNALRSQMHKNIEDALAIKPKLDYQHKYYQFGIFKPQVVDPTIKREKSRSPKQKGRNIKLKGEQKSSENLKYDFKTMNETRIKFSNDQSLNANQFQDLPRNIAEIATLKDMGEDLNQLTYGQAIGVLRLIEDVKNLENTDEERNQNDQSLHQQKLNALEHDIIEDVSYQPTQANTFFRELAPISRQIVQVSGNEDERIQKLAKAKDRWPHIQNQESHLVPENLSYADLINIVSGRFSQAELKEIFPEGMKNTSPVKPRLLRIIEDLQRRESLKTVSRNSKAAVDFQIQTNDIQEEIQDKEKEVKQQQEEYNSSGSEESPKNLGKIQSLKRKMLRDHSDQYNMMNRYDQIQLELQNVNDLKRILIAKTSFEEGFKIRQDMNLVILDYLRELFQLCLDSDQDMPDLLGEFPQGLAKLSHDVTILKGRKTTYGVTVGQIIRTILLEYRNIMAEFRRDDTIRHQLLQEKKKKEEERNRKYQYDVCHDYSISKLHREQQLSRPVKNNRKQLQQNHPDENQIKNNQSISKSPTPRKNTREVIKSGQSMESIRQATVTISPFSKSSLNQTRKMTPHVTPAYSPLSTSFNTKRQSMAKPLNHPKPRGFASRFQHI